ncbi:efflux RND transporter periplasmic adaptor subunit [Siphonobacter sp. SORGH_AS_0500]|uniref:efflux RND transporter periplasmic adaptor subunit n=1 Tax=Siphonobacter sp. SORGH_AS_0500 TaxID=1864824 RepID=UPI0028599318|nr:efflux RND transporter periplasmic adaptor subunit [Siphonobacter sp. SORGH_AS_0500]MDR6197661.1 membrane fusion protein (multidrug efflux system) [Siphonobacter sp. SORGH_AS_0500]
MKHFPSLKNYTLTTLLFLTWIGLAGCTTSAENQTEQTAAAPQKRSVITLKENSVTLHKEYPARIEGKVNVDIRPQAEGYLERIYVEEGAYVKAGQPLFKIADAPYREALHTAQANLGAAQADLKKASLEVDKFRELSQSRVTSEFQLKTAKTAYETAKANVALQEAAVATARINLGFTLVKAPVSGFIGRIPKRIGNLASKTDTEPMTTLSDISQVYAYFSMTEQDFLRLSRQSDQSLTQTLKQLPAVQLILADGKPFEHSGKVQMVDGKFDTGTGSISVRAAFTNPRHLLRSGNTGRIVLPETHESVMLIPVQAVSDIQDKLYVFRLTKDNRAERIAIIVNGKSGDNYVLVKGLNPGDRIIAKDAALVTEGEQVAQ